MKILINSDHTGINLRKKISKYLQDKEYEVEDIGTDLEKTNYADQSIKLATEIQKNPENLGIIICGTGIGVSIAANKVKSIRCALVVNETMAKYAKEHNNANMIALGSRINSDENNIKYIQKFLDAEFEKGRHIQRIDTISEYEERKGD